MAEGTESPAAAAQQETSITEGKATIYFASQKGVFYNPPQIPNRDLSVLALRQFVEDWQEEQTLKAAKQVEKQAARAAQHAAECANAPATGSSEASVSNVPAPAATPAVSEPGIRVLDALSATGLRAIRYTKEVEGLRSVVANDLDPAAVEVMRSNLRRNGIDETQVQPHVGDAIELLHASKPPLGQRFEVIDLDPYGTAAPFLDSAVQAVADGGMLMVTCTDLAVLCATYPEACYAKYHAYPVKAKYCHEAALRIVLGCISTHAARHGRYVTPLLCTHINFYVRLFVRVHAGKQVVKQTPTKMAYVYQCSGCESFALQPVARLAPRKEGAKDNEKVVAGAGPPVDPRCAHCDCVHHVAGPMWSAPLHDARFVEKLLSRLQRETEYGTHRRVFGLLTSVAEELSEAPLFVQLAAMCSNLHVTCPPLIAVFSALMRKGYKVSRSHTDPMAIKTDAPQSAIWDVLRCWTKEQTSKKPLSETSPGFKILAQEPTTQADFRPWPDAQVLLSKKDRDNKDGKRLGAIARVES